MSGMGTRAVIYGVGHVGAIAARLMVEKGIEIVGAINRAGPKVGRDLGDLAGMDRDLGVVVDDDPDAVLAGAGADVVLVSVQDKMEEMFPIYAQCIENGLNVISLGAHASYPWRIEPDITGDLDRLAKRHGVTITGGGNQDFFMVNLGILATGISHRLDSITHHSLTDVNTFGPEVAALAHVGVEPAEYHRRVEAAGNAEPMSIYTTFWDSVAAGLGLTIDNVNQRTEPILGERAVFCRSLDGDIPAGHVIGLVQRLEIDTCESIRMHGEYTLKVCAPREYEYKDWHLRGEPDLDIHLDRLNLGLTTATQAVNRIPDVIDSEPGYVTLERLPNLHFRSRTPSRPYN